MNWLEKFVKTLQVLGVARPRTPAKLVPDLASWQLRRSCHNKSDVVYRRAFRLFHEPVKTLGQIHGY